MTQRFNGPHLSRRAMLGAGAAVGIGWAAGSGQPAHASGPPGGPGAPGAVPEPEKRPSATGHRAAVSSVDPYASDVGMQVLASGGRAADAAVAMAAVLGVTEPFSAGIGGGGFFVHRDAASGRVQTIDGRETAPMAYTEDEFTDGAGNPLDFDEVVNSGRSVGVPGTLATWTQALSRFGSRDLGSLLKPAEHIAQKGFVVDENFRSQIESNAERFSRFIATAELFLPGGAPPALGSRFRNKDLAATYRRLRTHGAAEFYNGKIGRALLAEANRPTTAPGAEVPGSTMTMADLTGYRAPFRDPTISSYLGMSVHGMDVPSSGGIAVGQILNLLHQYELRTGIALADLSEVEYRHRFAEACATAFADRNRWVGDIPDVPVAELLSEGFAAERAELFDAERAQERPIPFGFPDGDYGTPNPADGRQDDPYEGESTTHLNVMDQWGNTVSYTLTIEQTGGSGITVPGHGFLLNNELTDFNFVPITDGIPDPNLPGPGKRPRSSMSPTILTEGDQVRLSVGTPGGATIITSVAQIIVEYLERGRPLVDSIAAARLSSRNSSTSDIDLDLIGSDVAAELAAMGHQLEEDDWIGNASAIAREGHEIVAAAETVRGGGGAARAT